MAKQAFAANALIGGVSGCLDDILHTALENGNIAMVVSTSNQETYFYRYDTSETGAESSPDIIIPDSNLTGSGAWVLVGMYGSTIKGTSIQLGGAGATPTEFSTDTTLGGDSDTAIPTEKAVKTYVDNATSGLQGVPTGVILPFGGTSAPTGYLLCDGSAVSRTTYNDLFTEIGTAFGIGDGATTFNLPDMQGNLPRGKNADAVGDTGGSDTKDISHVHSGPNHQHSGTSLSGSQAAHTHQWYKYEASAHKTYNNVGTEITIPYTSHSNFHIDVSNTSNGLGSGVVTGCYTTAAGNQSVTISGNTGFAGTGNTGSGGSATQNFNSPYVVVNYIIKT